MRRRIVKRAWHIKAEVRSISSCAQIFPNPIQAHLESLSQHAADCIGKAEGCQGLVGQDLKTRRQKQIINLCVSVGHNRRPRGEKEAKVVL